MLICEELIEEDKMVEIFPSWIVFEMQFKWGILGFEVEAVRLCEGERLGR